MPARHHGNEEADQFVIGFDGFLRSLGVPELLPEPGYFVVEDVTQTFEEDEREDVVLELRRVDLAPNLARSIPEPGFEGGNIERHILVGHGTDPLFPLWVATIAEGYGPASSLQACGAKAKMGPKRRSGSMARVAAGRQMARLPV